MIIPKPKIFEQFPELIFGLSKKINFDPKDEFNFNMSLSIGDSEDFVLTNRKRFFSRLGLEEKEVVLQKQIHSDIINIVDEYKNGLEGDALITSKKGLGLAVSTADCTNIFIYDKEKKIISTVHSGWMGTEKEILRKTVQTLFNKFNSTPSNLFCYMGPSISQINYVVGSEFQSKFDEKYLKKAGEKLLLDLKTANLDMLLNEGSPKSNIQISEFCSHEILDLHSYRRDKSKSGRALGIIAIDKNA